MTPAKVAELRGQLGRADAALRRVHASVEHMNNAGLMAYATALSSYVTAAVALDAAEQQQGQR